MELAIALVLMLLLAVTALAVARSRNLVVAVMLYCIYSLLSAALFMLLDAPDVAFTEAAVGAGISTLLMLAALAYGISDLPPFGDAGNPIHHHVVPRYLEGSPGEVGVPNTVAAVLASYRGYDTLGETVVIFTAGIGVLLLLGRWRRGAAKEEQR